MLQLRGSKRDIAYTSDCCKICLAGRRMITFRVDRTIETKTSDSVFLGVVFRHPQTSKEADAIFLSNMRSNKSARLCENSGAARVDKVSVPAIVEYRRNRCPSSPVKPSSSPARFSPRPGCRDTSGWSRGCRPRICARGSSRVRAGSSTRQSRNGGRGRAGL